MLMVLSYSKAAKGLVTGVTGCGRDTEEVTVQRSEMDPVSVPWGTQATRPSRAANLPPWRPQRGAGLRAVTTYKPERLFECPCLGQFVMYGHCTATTQPAGSQSSQNFVTGVWEPFL